MKLLSSILRPLGVLVRARTKLALLRGWLMLAPRDKKAARALMSHAAAMGDRSAARAAGEAILKAAPADLETLKWLADTHMGNGDAEAAHGLYVRLAERENSPVRPGLYRTAHMNPALAAAKEPYVHTLRDVILETERCAIFDGDKVYIKETSGRNLGNHPGLTVRATPDRGHFVISRPEPATAIEEACVLIGTDGGYNYGHWLFRNVLKLALLERAGVGASMPLLINDDLRGYQVDLIDALEIPQSCLMRVRRGEVIRCREIIVPVLLRNHPRMRFAIDWLRARLAGFIEPAGQARDLLYISRRDSRSHVLLNEAELEDALGRLGFRIVVLSEMPFTEQVRAISGARVIVGAHGAGLTNIMFAPPHATIVEISNTHLRHMGDFRAISEQMGLRHVEIVSDRYPATQATTFPPYYDYYADMQAVLESIREITEAPIAARNAAA